MNGMITNTFLFVKGCNGSILPRVVFVYKLGYRKVRRQNANKMNFVYKL